jgi:alpha-tubulin suppressor-like RCC1 family protein
MSDTRACNANGVCVSPNTCLCNAGFHGSLCQSFDCTVFYPNVSRAMITNNASLIAFGSNSYGEIGDGTSGNNRQSPVSVITYGVLYNKIITAMALGFIHSIVVSSDGYVYGWGNNDFGQLGDGTNGTNRLTPVAVVTSGVLLNKAIIAVSAGYEYTIAISSDGNVYSWGSNNFGQLGDGTNGTNRLLPVAVVISGVLGGTTFISGSANYQHTLVQELCTAGEAILMGS